MQALQTRESFKKITSVKVLTFDDFWSWELEPLQIALQIVGAMEDLQGGCAIPDDDQDAKTFS
ncbi:hypothetical protein [Paracoccus aerius]|uniref:Uncharacterized protein n=1 Tax=Paracoccus aerius TaxID=1915382 RepID=A0ABS1S6P1_9RHOB|nr:hypothetical protein [Paracoccus aerius]MBL3674402.1 hypothetical protein [Paracoccus aerius]